MQNLILTAFFTGLTAGGLSCYIVQGGLLTGAIAPASNPAVERSSRPEGRAKSPAPGLPAILLFTSAKIVAYTLLGFLLGALGSAFTITPFTQGAIQIAIGIFLVGNALRMFNVHPIFRYFTFEPPASVRRYIRKLSKDDSAVTPLFLGAMTVLIPCGVTQAVMAVAIASADPMLGAAIMFAFTLGASPAFIAIAWATVGVGRRFEKFFNPAVAVILLVMGLVTLDAGLTLAGSPISTAALMRPAAPADPAGFAASPITGPFQQDPGAAPGAEASASAASASGDFTDGSPARITVENDGYAPEFVLLPAGKPVELHLMTEDIHSCARAFYIPDLDLVEMLPETGDTVVTIPAQESGTVMQFMCTMGMYTGWFQFQ